jgi:hypothetical protein
MLFLNYCMTLFRILSLGNFKHILFLTILAKYAAGAWRTQKLFGLEVKARNRIFINDLLNVLLVIYFKGMEDFHFEALGQRFKKSIKGISLFLAPSILHFYSLITQKMLSHPVEFL